MSRVLSSIAGLILGKQTGRQRSVGSSTAIDAVCEQATQALAALGNQATPPPPCPKTYRTMRCNPTLTLARAALAAPILAAPWTTEARDDCPPEVIRYVERFIKRLRIRYLANALQALEYGYKPLEIVWSVEAVADAAPSPAAATGAVPPASQKDTEGGPLKPAGAEDSETSDATKTTAGSQPGVTFTHVTQLIVKDLKPLAVEKTKPIEDATGAIVGIRNFEKELAQPYYMWITHDAEDDSPYGRSRYENVRETAWWGWQQAFSKQLAYLDRAAAPTPYIEYPPGMSADVSGTQRSNLELALNLASTLKAGRPIVMPNTLAAAARDLLDRGVPLDKVRAWSINFLEASVQHGGEYVETMRYHDSGMLRGWLVPERTATEGQYGTKAEATAHAQLAISMAQLLLNDLVEQLNKQCLYTALKLNFNVEDEVCKIIASPLSDPVKDMIEAIMTQVLSSNAPLLESWLDVDAMLGKLGLPKAAEVVDAGVSSAIARITQAAEEKVKQAAPQVPSPGKPGEESQEDDDGEDMDADE